ncbi:uncharacterized protein [Paralichthys olivaceus]|uniref:uncharacterized protein isoform X2 n=1 Tax=Paralichthys olivaceus TaxID=8255 RepID=UPI00375147AD
MFGREAMYPTEVPEEYLVTDEGVEALIGQETQPLGTQNLPAHYTIAQANMGKMRDKIKRKREELGQDDRFEVGDKVMRANKRQEQKKGGGMETSMLGPFTIIKLEGKSADLVTEKSKMIHKVNIDQLNRYIEPTPRIPHKWVTDSPSSPTVSPSPPAISPSSPAISPSSPAVSPSPHAISVSSPAMSAVFVPAKLCKKVHLDTLEAVETIWAEQAPEVLRSKIGPYLLFTHNLREHLSPGTLLESEIINAYLTLCLRKFSRGGKGQCFLIDSFQMTDIWKGKTKGLRKVDPLDYDIMVGAVCENQHWTLTVMYPKEKRSVYVDPFGAQKEALQKCSAVTR